METSCEPPDLTVRFASINMVLTLAIGGTKLDAVLGMIMHFQPEEIQLLKSGTVIDTEEGITIEYKDNEVHVSSKFSNDEGIMAVKNLSSMLKGLNHEHDAANAHGPLEEQSSEAAHDAAQS